MFTSFDRAGSTTMIAHQVTSSSDVIVTSRQRPISVVSMTDSVQSAAQVRITPTPLMCFTAFVSVTDTWRIIVC